MKSKSTTTMKKPVTSTPAKKKPAAKPVKELPGVVDTPPATPEKKVKAPKPDKPVRCFMRLAVVMGRAKKIQEQQAKNAIVFDALYARASRHPKWAQHTEGSRLGSAFCYADVLAL